MAFDPKDPADKKILTDAIAAREAELAAEHEAEISGLKAKNKDLLGKIKRGIEADPAEIERLETEVETLQGKVREYDKSLKTISKERDALRTSFETESAASRKLLIDSALTSALVDNKIGEHYLPAVKALLSSKVAVKTEGDNRIPVVNDKPLGEFVKAWSLGDEGKAFVIAAVNGGGCATGGKASGNAKVVSRADYEANPSVYAADFKTGAAVLGE